MIRNLIRTAIPLLFLLSFIYLGISYGLYHFGIYKGPIIHRILKSRQLDHYGLYNGTGEVVLLEKPLWAEKYTVFDIVGNYAIANPTKYRDDVFDERIDGKSYYRVAGSYDEATGEDGQSGHRWYPADWPLMVKDPEGRVTLLNSWDVAAKTGPPEKVFKDGYLEAPHVFRRAPK